MITLQGWWTILELIITCTTVALSLYLFLKDPIRRSRFLGYVSTAIAILIDPRTNNVCITKTKGFYAFPQGGIYELGIYSTIEQILLRELNLQPNQYKLDLVKALGNVQISGIEKTQKTKLLGGISLSKTAKGKGYVACFVLMDLTKINKGNHKLGYNVQELSVVEIPKAIKLMGVKTAHRINSKKIDLIEDALNSYTCPQ